MIYLDHAATSPPLPEVIAAVTQSMEEGWGNPASPHTRGRLAAEAVARARSEVANLLGTTPQRVVFTSGATESLNAAVRAAVAANPSGRVVVAATEHKAALVAAQSAPAHAIVPVAGDGTPDLETADRLVADRPCAALVIMAVNNETGVALDTRLIAEIGRAHGVPVIVDATQQAGRLPVESDTRDLDYVAVSAHKLGGPPGVGALVTPREASSFTALLQGGGQENGRRSGTLNVPGIVGFGVAAASVDHASRAHAEASVRRIYEGLAERLGADSLTWHGASAPRRAPGFCNLRIAGVDADALVATTHAVQFATGSACTSSTPTPSHVLLAMGVDRLHADESIRLTPANDLSEDEADRAVEAIARAATRLRKAGAFA